MKKLIVIVQCIVFICSYIVSSAQVIEGTYAIKNMQTGMLLRIKDANKSNGTPLVAYDPVNWKCVTWQFNHVEGDTYQLKNLFTGKTFQSTDATPSEGSLLNQQPLILLQLNQQYDFVPVKNNSYLIKQKNTNLYVTPVDKNGAANTGIRLAKKDGSLLQQWVIYLQKPTM